jgi:hypothetical protein
MVELFNETIAAHPTYGLRQKDFFVKCISPSVRFYNITNTDQSNNHDFEYTVNTDKIACRRSGTKAIQEVDHLGTVNVNGEERLGSSVNVRHNYIELANYSRTLSMAVREEIRETPTWGTDTGKTACDPNSTMRDDKKESVHKDARQNAYDNIIGVVDDAVDNTDKSSYIGVSEQESASWWPREDNPNNITDIDCDLTIKHDNITCNNEDCDADPQHTHIDYRGSDDDDCTEYYCKSHTHSNSQDEDELVKKEYDYNVSLAKYEAEIELTDNDHEVATYDGKVNIPFDFQYNHTINPSWPY